MFIFFFHNKNLFLQVTTKALLDRGKLTEALMLAVASCEDLEEPRKVQLLHGIMEQAGVYWR